MLSCGFLGRREELSALPGLLERSRLVTITGAPGIGKTRLALELAGGLAPAFPDGTRLVELAAAGDPALVPRAVASALSVREVGGVPLSDVLVAHLRDRRLLLVLDNCEHLLGACAELVQTLMGRCAKLGVVATSREALGVPGERVWPLAPLSVPGTAELTPERLEDFDAVRLFIARARAAQPGFSLNAYVAPAVAEITRRLDGIPLAIELAAARIEMLTPAEIARRLEDRFGLLRDDGPGVLPRHQTLRAALEWSHDLLSAGERAVLRRVSVFVGAFDLQAAEVVCVGDEVEPGEVVRHLAALVAKSLVVVDANTPPFARYRLLETIRAYAGARLEQAGEQPGRRDAHARCYLALAEAAEPQLTGPDQQPWLERLEAEHGNLIAAVEWSLGHDQIEQALRLTGALVLFWRVRCHFSAGGELLDAAVAAGEGAALVLRTQARWGAGFMALMAGDPESAIPVLEASLSGFRELDDRQGCARALLLLGNCEQYRDMPRARSLLEQSTILARETGDLWCLAHTLGVSGFGYESRDELAAARRLFEECLDVARLSQDAQSLRMGLLGLGSVLLHQGDYRLAESVLEDALALSGELGEDYGQATALQYLAEVAFGRGQYDRARALLDKGIALMRQGGSALSLLNLLVCLARTAHAQGDQRRARRLFDEVLAQRAFAAAAQGLAELTASEGDRTAARQLFEEALDMARGSGARLSAAEALHGLGQLARRDGDAARAAALHDEALQLRRQIGSAAGIAASLEAVAGLAAAQKRPRDSAHLFGAAQAVRDGGVYARVPWESSRHAADVVLVRRSLSAEEFEDAFAQGRALPTEEAVAMASGGHERRRRPASTWSSLTEREYQVAALVAEGLTNPTIAARLFVSLSTVKADLSSIYAKLGLAGRSELSREVWRRERHPLATGR